MNVIRMRIALARCDDSLTQTIAPLTQRVDAIVVVSNLNPDRIRRFISLCHQQLTPTLHVHSAEELEPEWFDDVRTVGLVTDTSTPESVAHELCRSLERIGLPKTERMSNAKAMDSTGHASGTAT